MTETWGGAREGAGRPTEGLVHTSVSLYPAQIEYLHRLGGGVVSRGVRIVTDAHPEMVRALEKIVNHWDDLHPKDRQQARAALDGARGKESE